MEFTAVIANLGKHAAGIVAETPLSFPTATEQVQAALRAIGVDGVRYEEVMVKDYSIGIDGIAPLLGEYAHIDELNYVLQPHRPGGQAGGGLHHRDLPGG